MITMIQEGGRDMSRRALHKTEPPLIEESHCSFLSRRDDNCLFCCRCRCRCHKRRASPLTCLAICFLVLTYNLFGGFLFLALEGTSTSAEETSVADSKPNLSQIPNGDLRSKTVERLWSITEDLNILYKENWTKIAAKELMDFQKVLMKSMQRGNAANMYQQYDSIDYRWTFAGSFLYALTLITAIGHGSVTPKSPTGKVVAIAYACVGIPLIMLYLSTIGEALARNFRSLYSKLCPARLKSGDFHSKADCLSRYSLPGVECKQFVECDRKENVYERQKRTPFQAALNLDSFNGGYHWTCRDHTRVPIILSLLLILLYIALGTFVFPTTENGNFIDGCYFSFSSLATIGFGNLKPGLYASAISAKAEDVAVGVCCIYILVGIVVVAMCFNLIQEDMSSALRGFTALCTGSSKTRPVHNVEKCDEKISIAIVS